MAERCGTGNHSGCCVNAGHASRDADHFRRLVSFCLQGSPPPAGCLLCVRGWSKKGSGSASTQAALELIGTPFRVVETASWEQNEAFQDLLKLNPLGQIPTLVLEDGSVLSESAAILIHLGSVHPQSGLLPGAPAA